jgi:hypothetical protein
MDKAQLQVFSKYVETAARYSLPVVSKIFSYHIFFLPVMK